MFIIETGSLEPTTTPDPAVEAPPASPADTGAEPDLFDTGADSFPREYVERLRRENAEHRTKYAPYRDVFDGVEPDVQDYLLGVNKMLLSSDKTQAVSELRELLSHLDPDSAAGQAVQDKIDEIDPDAPLTLRQWEEIQSKKAEKAKAEDEVNGIYETARTLDPSYDKDADEYGDLASLLFIASHKTKGDLQAAHELRAKRFAAAVETEVERRLGEVKAGARKWAPIVATGNVPAEPKDEPKTFADARKRADSRLSRILQG